MASEQLKFVENHKEYVDIHNIICRGCRDDQKIWVENDLVLKLQNAFIQSKSTPKSEFKILAVGSNNGSFDCLFIKALFSHAKELMDGKQVIYTVVDPNTVAIEEFKHNVATQYAIFQGVNFNWVNKRMEEFLDAKEPELYDLIHFIHVLYYAENEEEILKSAYERFLASPGCIVTAVAVEGNIWVNLMKSFKGQIPSLSRELHYPTNKELSVICGRNGWTYDTFDGKLDLEVTEIFIEGDPIGEAMLKYFLQINEDPKGRYGEELISEVMEFFRRMSWETTTDDKKFQFVNDDEGILLIYKRA